MTGATWHADPYHLAPGPKSLLTLYGAGHALGGVSGYDAAETTDEDPARVEVVAQTTAAYLTTQLGLDQSAWRHGPRFVHRPESLAAGRSRRSDDLPVRRPQRTTTSMSEVFVPGISGSIGSRVARRLLKTGTRVRGLVRTVGAT